MAEFEKVGQTGELGEGEMKLVKAGPTDIVLAKVSGEVLAFTNLCSHAECSFADDGQLDGDELECNCHGSRFNVRTGEVLNGPAEDPLKRYSVRLEGDDILVGPEVSP